MRLFVWFGLLVMISVVGWIAVGSSLEAELSSASLVTWMERVPGYGWLVGWVLLVADVFLPIPGTVVMSALGWVYGAVWGGLLAAVGSVLAGLVAYGVGRLFGERGARAILGAQDFERGRQLFRQGGGWLVCLSRAWPIFPEVVACTAGLVRMPLRRFLPPLVCGSVPMGWVFAAIGAAGREMPGLALGLSLALPAVLWGLARRGWMRKSDRTD